MACSSADIAELVHRLPRERELEVSSYTSYSDKEIKKIALGFDNNEIANYLIADKQTVGSTRSKRKKEIASVLLA